MIYTMHLAHLSAHLLTYIISIITANTQWMVLQNQ